MNLTKCGTRSQSHSPIFLSPFLLPLSFFFLSAGWLAFAQAPKQQAPQQNPQQPQSKIKEPQLDSDAIVRNLNGVISWYRHIIAEQPKAGLPSDVIYQQDAKSLAAQAVKLAFDSARAEAVLISSFKGNRTGGENAASTPQGASTQQNLARTQNEINSKINQLQDSIAALDKQIAAHPKHGLEDLQTQRKNLQGELDLAKTMQENMNKVSTFIDVNGNSQEGLQGTINQLAASVPEILGASASTLNKPGAPGTNAAPPANNPQNAESNGLYGQSIQLYDQLQGEHQLNLLISETNRVSDLAKQVRQPLINSLSEAFQLIRDNNQNQNAGSGNAPASGAQGAPASNNPSAPDAQNFEEMTNRFKKISNATIPLSEEIIVLEQDRSNLTEWRDSISAQTKHLVRAIVVRAVTVLFALLILFVLSEIWRRFTFRYVHDARRRRQILLVRRFVMGFLVGLAIILGFVSQFSSLATFAGLITAGIAVGLQTIILSMAAYFLLIGRYGIRVGDRISVAGVTGDVIDTGLVRFYLTELAGTGVDLYPTGRIVLFSNSVLFQAATPLYKQIPGAEYTWHEVAVDLAPEGNHKLAQDRIKEAVLAIYQRYRVEMERQHGNIEQRIEVQLSTPNPETRLQFTEKGLEFLVRYPVGIRGASDIDEEITRKLLEMFNKEPELKNAVSGTPKIRSVTK